MGVHILSFVPDEDMVNVVGTTRGLGDKVQGLRNTEQRYAYSLTRRLHNHINILQEGPGRGWWISPGCDNNTHRTL